MKRRTMLFEQFNQVSIWDALIESVTGELKDVKDEVKDVMDELGKEGAQDDELKAALLMQALDKDGNIEDVDVDQLKKDVKEGMTIRGQSLNESTGGIVHVLELAGNVLGNAAFLEFLSKKLEKLTGKAMDPGKMKATIEKLLGGLKKVTGLPGKAISKFFSWVAGKLGADINGKKVSSLLGTGALIVFLFALGVSHFPVLGTGVLWWLLSLTGLVGKSTELLHIYKEIKEIIKKAAEGKDKKAEEEIGVSGDELEKLVTA